MRALAVRLLVGWALLTDSRALQTFGSEAACEAAIVGFQAQARAGALWVRVQQQATIQGDPALTLFWRQASRRSGASGSVG
jgi:hypothetical protein